MKHHPMRAQLAIASLLTLLLVAITVVPASAVTPLRRAGAEAQTIRLVNCMRSGGHVTKYATCKGWGSGRYSKYVKPLRYSDRISDKVSWPWARKSVQFYGTRTCWIGHRRNGSTVDKRFAAASLRHIANGENMGCGYYGTARATALRVTRMWQAEKSYNGPHWRQIKDPKFVSVGVASAKYGSRKSQLVMNFYGKLVK